MAAPVFESVTHTNIDGTSQPFDMPVTRPNDDLYVMVASSDSPGLAADWFTNGELSGWTTRFATVDAPSANTSALVVAWRIGSSEPSTYTLTGHTFDAGQVSVVRISGTDLTTPINASGSDAATTATPTAPAVVPSVADTLVMRLFHADDDGTSGPGSDSAFTSVPATTRWNRAGAGSNSQAGSTEAGPAASTSTGTAAAAAPSDQWIAGTLAIAPVAGGSVAAAVATSRARTVARTVTVAATGTVTTNAVSADVETSRARTVARTVTTAATATAWSRFLRDTFTGTNLTPIYQHTPDVGGTWEELPFTSSATAPGAVDPADPESATTDYFAVLLFNGEAITRGDPKRSATYRNTADPGADEYDVALKWEIGNNAIDQYHWLMVRMTPTGTAYADVDHYMVVADPGVGNQWELYKAVSGTRTLLDTDPGPVAIDNTTADVLVKVRTTGIDVYVNGTLTLTTTDTAVTQRGRVGFGMASGDPGSPGHLLDNLNATAPPSTDVDADVATSRARTIVRTVTAAATAQVDVDVTADVATSNARTVVRTVATDATGTVESNAVNATVATDRARTVARTVTVAATGTVTANASNATVATQRDRTVTRTVTAAATAQVDVDIAADVATSNARTIARTVTTSAAATVVTNLVTADVATARARTIARTVTAGATATVVGTTSADVATTNARTVSRTVTTTATADVAVVYTATVATQRARTVARTVTVAAQVDVQSALDAIIATERARTVTRTVTAAAVVTVSAVPNGTPVEGPTAVVVLDAPTSVAVLDQPTTVAVL